MQELVIIKNSPAKITANFAQVEAAIDQELERYNIVVTVDTVSDAKKLATELNGSKKTIKDAGKAAFDKSIEPANEFMKKVNELVAKVESSRQSLLAQIAKFEDETRELVRTKLEELRSQLWDSYGVESDFRSVKIDDLILLSSITKIKNLTKAATDAVEMRVRDNKADQDKIKMRLVMLENQSYKAGLAAPLTRDHVLAFLYADDNTYNSQLNRMIASETIRQEEAEKKLRAQITKEQSNPLPTTKPESVEMVAEKPAAQIQQPVAPQEPTAVLAQPNPTKIPITVTATFSLQVNPRITNEAIEAELHRMMSAAGITSLTSVSINRAAILAA